MSSPQGMSWLMNKGGLNSIMGQDSQPVSTTSSGARVIKPQQQQVQQPINPLIGSSVGDDYTTDNQGNLYRGNIPVDDKNSHIGTFADPNTAPKPLTTGQRLLQGIKPTIGATNNPAIQQAALKYQQIAATNSYHGIQQKQAEQGRIQQLTSLLSKPSYFL